MPASGTLAEELLLVRRFPQASFFRKSDAPGDKNQQADKSLTSVQVLLFQLLE
jgi:hypothetical protein